jgi:methionine synthase I (cobalamin-dependent)
MTKIQKGRQERIAALKKVAKERILILDGSWGVMIQQMGLKEEDYRGKRFAKHGVDLRGNNDILCLTRPDIVADLHRQYFAAGADISETNTFTSSTRKRCATSTSKARVSAGKRRTRSTRRSRTSRASSLARSGRSIACCRCPRT